MPPQKSEGFKDVHGVFPISLFAWIPTPPQKPSTSNGIKIERVLKSALRHFHIPKLAFVAGEIVVEDSGTGDVKVFL